MMAAPGPVVIIVAYLTAVTLVGLYGEGPIAKSAMTVLLAMVVVFLVRIANKVK